MVRVFVLKRLSLLQWEQVDEHLQVWRPLQWQVVTGAGFLDFAGFSTESSAFWKLFHQANQHSWYAVQHAGERLWFSHGKCKLFPSLTQEVKGSES